MPAHRSSIHCSVPVKQNKRFQPWNVNLIDTDKCEIHRKFRFRNRLVKKSFIARVEDMILFFFFFSPSPNRKNSFHWVDGEEIKTAGFNIHQFENIKIGGNDGSNIGACITR